MVNMYHSANFMPTSPTVVEMWPLFNHSRRRQSEECQIQAK